jgi:hypothetical protein
VSGAQLWLGHASAALVSAAAEDDRAGGGKLLSDQRAQLIVT